MQHPRLKTRSLSAAACALAVTAIAVALPAPSRAQVVASPPYAVSVFALNPPNTSQPDSIVTWKGDVIVGYQNHVAKDGTDNKSSTIVEFDSHGAVKRSFSVKGHNDGLRVVGESDLWAVQNEDANPNLVVINLESGNQTIYKFAPTPHGGGYDDIVVHDGAVYLTASNPNLDAHGNNVFPALVRAKLWMNQVVLETVLLGNAQATNISTGAMTTLNLTDPDSMTTDLNGDIVFTSQADSELIFVKHVGTPEQTVGFLSITSPVSTATTKSITIDDTYYARSHSDYLLVADVGGTGGPGGIYKITRSNFGFPTGQAYSASDTYGIVGTLGLDTGVVTPVVTGLQSARGLIFVRKESSESSDHSHEHGE
ncbi:MAG TPA: hypothetical protein VGD63_01560 [Steroidobacteraceae bacterium]